MPETCDHPPAVALVGFMGAGKSAVGRELAAALGSAFVDTDELIAAQAGPIETIFAERGEAAFRALEAEVVTAAVREARERPRVLALGGGAVLSAAVREALGRLPHVVWLTAPPEVLWRRARTEGQAVRPLALDETAFRALLATRESLYRQVATVVVDTAAKPVAAIAADIAGRLHEAPPEAAARRRAQGGVR
ncbi:MAG TPA: shikimate kinase [Thermoleophilia bacterium]|nr:shikimate kinase [Thermoleophilia bacterium]